VGLPGFVCARCSGQRLLARLGGQSDPASYAEVPVFGPGDYFAAFVEHAYSDWAEPPVPPELMEMARFLVAQAVNPQAGFDLLAEHGLLVLPPEHVRVGVWPARATPDDPRGR
jgi:hypothetical protein